MTHNRAPSLWRRAISAVTLRGRAALERERAIGAVWKSRRGERQIAAHDRVVLVAEVAGGRHVDCSVFDCAHVRCRRDTITRCRPTCPK